MALLSGPLADILERDRDTFNAMFVAARHRDGNLEGEAFGHHVVEVLDPIVRAVAKDLAEMAQTVTKALYELSLQLFGSALLGAQAKYPAIVDAWRRLLPRLPRMLGREPIRLAGAITNAVYNLSQTPGVQPRRWIDGMIELSGHCGSVASLLDAGKVLAWRVGMAQYRKSALALLGCMEPSLALRVLELPDSMDPATLKSTLERLALNRWVTPGDALAGRVDPSRVRLCCQSGAFRGFGGVFIRPPIVACQDGQLLVSDSQFTWLLLADVHGVVLHRLGESSLDPGRAADGVTLDPMGNVRWDQATGALGELAGWSSAACDGQTLAVTVPTSHHVFLVGRG